MSIKLHFFTFYIFFFLQFKDVLKLEEDLPHLKRASKVSLLELEKEMTQLRSGLKAVEKELEYHRTQSQVVTAGDRFVPAVKEFLASATFRFSDLEDKFQDMKSRVIQIHCFVFSIVPIT